MADYELASNPDFQKPLQLYKHLDRWIRASQDIKNPAEILEHEETLIKSRLHLASTGARNCVPHDLGLLRTFDSFQEQVINFASELGALKPGCDCKPKQRRETYRKRVDEHLLKCPIPPHLIPDDLPHSSPPSRLPSPRSHFGGGESTSPASPGSTGQTGGSATSPSTSPQQTASSRLSEDQVTPPEGECLDNEAPQAASGARTAQTQIDADGVNDGIVPDSTCIAPHHEQVSTAQRNKRKRPKGSLIATLRFSKQARLGDGPRKPASGEDYSNGGGGNGDGNDEDDNENNITASHTQPEVGPQPQEPRGAWQRTITFDEVYRGGNADPKHFIARFRDKQYIFRCDEHGMHFGDNPLQGASKHLAGRLHNPHNNRPRSHSRTVDVLGIQVPDSTEAERIQNNGGFKKALDEGYVPRGNPQAARCQGQPREQTRPTVNHRGRGPRRRGGPVVNPVPGGIYLFSSPTRGMVGVLVLPRGCLGDPSFAEIGLKDSLAETTLLSENEPREVPKCYRTCPDTGRITGWEKGYEDGGDRAGERRYPVIDFDGNESSRQVMWCRARNLETYDRDSWAANKELICNYAHLQQFEARLEKARTAGQDQRVAADDQSEVMDLETPQPRVSSPPVEATETAEVPPDAESPKDASKVPPESHLSHLHAAHTDQTSDPSNVAPLANMTPFVPPMSAALNVPPLPGASYGPMPGNIVGHVTTNGDGFPRHTQARPTTTGAENHGVGHGELPIGILSQQAYASLNCSRGLYTSLGMENTNQRADVTSFISHEASPQTTCQNDESSRIRVAPGRPAPSTVSHIPQTAGVLGPHSAAGESMSTESTRPPQAEPANGTSQSQPQQRSPSLSTSGARVVHGQQSKPSGTPALRAKRTYPPKFSPFRRSFDPPPQEQVTDRQVQHWMSDEQQAGQSVPASAADRNDEVAAFFDPDRMLG